MDLQKDVNVVNEFCETSETAKKLTKNILLKSIGRMLFFV